MKKAQSATEFVVLVSFMIIVFFIFFFVIQERIVDMSQEQDKQYLREANRLVSSELELAKNSLTDYTRTFTLRSFTNQEYDVELLDGQEIVTRYGTIEYVKFLQYNISGYLELLTISPTNTVYKTDGIITFSNGTIENHPEYNLISLNINPELCYKNHRENHTCPELDDNVKTDCLTYFTLCTN
jgi:cell division protein FtsI/penicillin-binding protein 2